jgi:hypothetical protein
MVFIRGSLGVRHTSTRRQNPTRNGIALGPPFERSGSGWAPLALRLRVYLTRGVLDRQIAAGRLHDSTAALAVRAGQLTDPQTLRQLARGLHRIVNYVERSASHPIFTAVVIDRGAVMGARHAILGLAERFEGPAPVSPRGVALAQLLLTDGVSPLFNRHSDRTVVQAIWEVQDALDVNVPESGLDAASV